MADRGIRTRHFFFLNCGDAHIYALFKALMVLQHAPAKLLASWAVSGKEKNNFDTELNNFLLKNVFDGK